MKRHGKPLLGMSSALLVFFPYAFWMKMVVFLVLLNKYFNP